MEQFLKAKCEETWEKLYETHSRIQSKKNNYPPTGIDNNDDNDVLKAILRAKEKKLQAEITAMKNENIEVPEKEELLSEEELKQKLEERTSHLESTLSVIEMQKQDMMNELEREEEIFQQNLEIQKSIQRKIMQLENEKENVKSGNSQVRELEKKIRITEENLRDLLKKLGAFIKEHFPIPSPEDLKEKEKKLPPRQRVVDAAQKYSSFHELLEDLLNKMWQTPHDPYVKIQPNHWPPYIELLLRCGIALRHQHDCNLIKLESFQA
ncbi:centromere protein K-like [Actinia tenebrosa]|uniref:Centromere protein K-like n=1 Tax=Actinia tenebrosa TaxID=6105 RepID=A0A6P8HU20_ACTTE|nr:centromere protein K-like [Actinia tenebrosa]